MSVLYVAKVVSWLTRSAVGAAGRAAAMVMDAWVMVFTWMKTFGTYRRLMKAKQDVSLSGIIVRDGKLLVKHTAMSADCIYSYHLFRVSRP